MDRLQQIGVQRWRRRRPSINPEDITAEPSKPNQPKLDSWQAIQQWFDSREQCESCEANNAILGNGRKDTDWVFVIDAPSSRDVQNQTLLAGRDGQLFDAILGSIGLDRDKIYLTSVFKCPPLEDLSIKVQCDELLHQQLQLIKPAMIVAMGEFAAQTVLRVNESLDKLRGQPIQAYSIEGVSVVPSFSLKQLLDSPELKQYVWQDLKKCLSNEFLI